MESPTIDDISFFTEFLPSHDAEHLTERQMMDAAMTLQAFMKDIETSGDDYLSPEDKAEVAKFTLKPAESVNIKFRSYEPIPSFFVNERDSKFYDDREYISQAVDEYYSLCQHTIERVATAGDSKRLFEINDGEITRGESSDYYHYRYFYDTDEEVLRLTKFTDLSALRNGYITQDMTVLPEADIIDKALAAHNKCMMLLTISGPGCGKTTDLITKAQLCDPNTTIILTTTRRGRESIALALPHYFVATIDSYLMAPTSRLCDVLLLDEVFLCHPGKLQLSVNRSQCAVAHGYGDYLQIPFIDRTSYNCRYSDPLKFFPVSHFLTHTYRCAVDVCYAISTYYRKKFGKGVRLTSSNLDRTMKLVDAIPKPFKYDVVLTLSQSDKAFMRRYHKKVYTVHEYQGGEANRIFLYISREVPYSLLHSESHAIVAISRHRSCLHAYVDADSVVRNLIVKASLASDKRLQKYYRTVGGGEGQTVEAFSFKVYDQPFEVTAVPRISSSELPAYWKTNRTCVVKRGPSHDLRVVYTAGKHAVLSISSNFKYTYSDIKRLFFNYENVIRDRYIVYNQKTFPSIDSALVVRVLNSYGALGVRIVSTRDHVLSKEACDFASTNLIDGLGEQLDVVVTAPLLEKPFVSIDPPDYDYDQCVAYIQDMIIEVYGYQNVYTSTAYDDFMFHTNPLHINIDAFRMTTNINELERSMYSKMVPNLLTPCPRTQAQTPRNALWSIMKRNANVPHLTSVDDVELQASLMVDRVFELCPTLCTAPIDLSAVSVQEWLDEQPEHVRSQIDTEICIENTPVDVYKFQIKSNPKPDLTVEALTKYPAVQTILSQSKDLNAFFCPVMRVVRDRLLNSMAKNFKFYTKVDDYTFGKELTRDFPPDVASKYKALEFDMSKYDKSQGELILEFECKFMLRVGVPSRFVTLWRNAHVRTKAYDMTTRISFETIFQRKSGDAATYLGNTLCLFTAITDVIKPSDIAFGAFSGDDSLLFVDHDLAIDYSLLSTRYNFEVKLFDFRYHYFCSKYILDVDNEWWIVPDPVKRGVKLGRNDLVNEEHQEEYRVSLLDNVAVYADVRIAEATSLAMCERHRVNYNFVPAILAIKQITKKSYFDQLFERPIDGVICEDPSRPKLDL